MQNPPKTRAQKLFLRAFRENPTGPAPADWPHPDTLRRWLDDDRFRQSLSHIRDALRFQADIHIATAAASAAKALQSTVTPAAGSAEFSPDTAALLARQLKSLTDLLRLAHLRQRFAAAAEPTPAQSAPPTELIKKSGPWDILEDPERLKSFFSLCIMQGDQRYEPFLAAFPEILAEAQKDATQTSQNQPPCHPIP